jgi:DMSO/TMAO reductase YedYZ molybdopterin-dependent catalytic subunit
MSIRVGISDVDQPATAAIGLEELQLAARNHGMPLEGLRYDVTPAGLHYLLIHYDIPDVDVASWRLEIDGAVGSPMTLSLDDIRSLPRVSLAVTLECAGNGRALLEPHVESQPWLVEAVGNAEWTGTPLRGVVERAAVDAEAVELVFTGLDHGLDHEVEQDYQRSLPLGEATREDVLLAYEMNGAPLPPQHGFPLRLVVPGWYGMTHVKWLQRITAATEPFRGFQMTGSYRIWTDADGEDAPGEPVERIQPRSLMAPPGFPDFFTRHRIVDRGPVDLQGKAWSGIGSIDRVEVSTDDCATWREASLGPFPASPFAWRGWRFPWSAEPGTYTLACRATDATGATQPVAAGWNRGGFRNNAVHRVPVSVR